MNQTIVKPNEFILRVIDDGALIRYQLENPHTRPGSDGNFSTRAFMAAYALIALAGKIKRMQNPIEDDESDPELHGG